MSTFRYTLVLDEIRKPAFKKGDNKFVTLLPSFNRKETELREEISKSQTYLITGAKRLHYVSPKFFYYFSRQGHLRTYER